MEYVCLNWRSNGKSRSCVSKVNSHEPITMTDLGGVMICGKRGGKSFAEAQRPQRDGKCPENMTACSDSTSLDNTICVLPFEQGAGECPITEIKLMS